MDWSDAERKEKGTLYQILCAHLTQERKNDNLKRQKGIKS